MWLVAFSARGYHAVPLPIMTGWLTCLLVFWDGFLRWACSRWPSHILLFSWRRICCEYLQVWKSFLGIFVSPIWVCLDYLESISLSSVCSNVSGIVRILFSCVLDRLEFAVLVIFVFRLGSKLPCLFSFYSIVLWIPCLFVSCRHRAVSFLVLFGVSWFVGNWLFLRGPWCRMFVLFQLN